MYDFVGLRSTIKQSGKRNIFTVSEEDNWCSTRVQRGGKKSSLTQQISQKSFLLQVCISFKVGTYSKDVICMISVENLCFKYICLPSSPSFLFGPVAARLTELTG